MKNVWKIDFPQLLLLASLELLEEYIFINQYLNSIPEIKKGVKRKDEIGTRLRREEKLILHGVEL